MRRLRQLGTLLLCAWSSAGATQPVITCSFSLPSDWTKVLIGDQAQVQTLAGPNTDLHAFQPSPADVRKLLSADLIVGIDPTLEPWLDDMVSSNKLNDKVLWVGRPWISGVGKVAADAEEEQPKRHRKAEVDPHLWMEPALVITMVDTLAQRCAKLPGIKADELERRRRLYQTAIQKLDYDLIALFAKIPSSQKTIVTHHENLRRFADHYGIRIVGVILHSTSTEAADPSAHALGALIQLCREMGVRAIVCDRGQHAPAAATLAREVGLIAPIELSIDSLDAPGTPSDCWLGLMRENARKLAEALQTR